MKQQQLALNKSRSIMQGVGITTLMVAVQCCDVGLNTIFKAATSKGMSNFVFIVYSNALAFCFLLPSTIIYHRKKAAPPITISLLRRVFVLSLVSYSVQTLTYTGIRYSSPTIASVMVDLTPAFTFMLAIIFRFEKLDLKLPSSQAKVIGTVVSITGALIVTLYKGMPLTSSSQPDTAILLSGTFLSKGSHRLLGCILLAAASFCLSLLFNVKTWIIKDYPAEMMVTTILRSFVAVLSAIAALIAERNPEAWILRPDMELLAIFYSAILVVSFGSILHLWACRKKGPVYVAMFTPLGMVIAVAMGVILLGDILYLGSMIGAAIISIGFYAVIWGQAQQEKMLNDKYETSNIVSSTSSAAPLLKNNCMHV
ncbi:hypothetical protein L6164_020596 [Bauhinia variegata]|uniref:Uncharacterized protein n=1 Tax=Bauhinia variegata TaxID=167791 RepID=A0ACB9MVY8_BAUVA|nr:hypothetical protein L6164_020596 [Bauhinia variegata]